MTTHDEAAPTALATPASARGKTVGEWSRRAVLPLVALFAFVPQLASQPGVVDSDTKSYLYIDPARFIAQSASMWDPDIALGTDHSPAITRAGATRSTAVRLSIEYVIQPLITNGPAIIEKTSINMFDRPSSDPEKIRIMITR